MTIDTISWMPIAGNTDDPWQALAAITEMDGETIGRFAFAVTFDSSTPATPVPAPAIAENYHRAAALAARGTDDDGQVITVRGREYVAFSLSLGHSAEAG